MPMPAIKFKILFESGDHFPIVRRKHFTVTEIFAFVGGLLGLFLGISVVSFAEVVNILLQPIFRKLSMTSCFQKKSTRNYSKKNRFFKNFSEVKSYFGFYLKESSIHSFNFIADTSNSFERLFWFLSFSFSLTGCFFMISQLYQTMDFKAVDIVIDDKLTHVSEIPFPAITIFGRLPSKWKLWFPKMQSFDEIDRIPRHWSEVDMSLFEIFEHPTSRFCRR